MAVRSTSRWVTVAGVLLLAPVVWASGATPVRVDLRDGHTINGKKTVLGRLVLESAETIVVRTLAGKTLTIPWSKIMAVRREVSLEAPPRGQRRVNTWLYDAPLPKASPGTLRRAFGARCNIRTTAHYVLCYNTSAQRASTTGQRLEQVYHAFFDYFHKRGFSLDAPAEKLVCMLFDRRERYHRYAQQTSKMLEHSSGFYSQQTKRIAFYVNLNNPEYVRCRAEYQATERRVAQWQRAVAQMRSGYLEFTYRDGRRLKLNRAQAARELVRQRKALRDDRRRMYLSQVSDHISVLAHEATHQLVACSRLLNPKADNPLWVDEGLAMFFEPAMRAQWAGIGHMNQARLAGLIEAVVHQRQLPLEQLLVLRRFLGPDKGKSAAAYAQSWGLTYYLMRQYQPLFLSYLRELKKQPAGASPTDAERIALFKKVFGPDLRALENRWYQYILVDRF